MTKKEKEQILESGKALIWDGYYFDSLLGLLVLLMAPIAVLFSPTKLLEGPTWFQLFISFLLLLSVRNLYGLRKERDLELIHNSLSIEENEKLLKKALDKLGWSYEDYAHELFIHSGRGQYYPLQFVYTTLIYDHNLIAFNMLYIGSLSSVKRARWPYFFGIKTFLYRKLRKAIEEELNKALV